jgi:hypothetical protein
MARRFGFMMTKYLGTQNKNRDRVPMRPGASFQTRSFVAHVETGSKMVFESGSHEGIQHQEHAKHGCGAKTITVVAKGPVRMTFRASMRSSLVGLYPASKL